MAGDKKIEYEVTANPDGFRAGMDKIAAASQEAEKQIKDSFKAVEGQMKSMMDGFKSVTGVMAGLTAVMVGGGSFKEILSGSAAWAGEATKLSTQLGVTTERASVLMVAMRHLGIDSELITSASAKMSKQIFSNGDAFKKMGVDVKDSSGQYRPVTTVMAEVNEKLKAIKNPIEQNIAGMQMYGKGWQEVRGTLKLTAEEMQKAEQKAKDFGLVVGDEGRAQARRYRESMNDMGLVMESINGQLGDVLLPSFIKVGSWLSSYGPAAGRVMGVAMESLSNVMGMVGEVVMELWGMVRTGFSAIGDLIASVMGGEAPGAMEIFAIAMKTIEIAFLAFKTSFQMNMEIIKGMIEVFVTHIMRMGAVAERVFHLDFSGAKTAWNNGTQQIEDIATQHAKNLVKIASDAKDKLYEIALRPAKAPPEIKDEDRQQDGKHTDFSKEDKEKSKARMNVWEERLALEKDGFEREQQIAGTAQEFGKARERGYWKNILDTVSMSAQERVTVNRKYLALEHDLRKDAFDSEVAGEKAKLEQFKFNFNERIAIATRIYEDLKARYGADSKEAKAALGDIAKEQRKLAEQTLASDKIVTEAKRAAATAQIDFQQQEAELQVALGEITRARLLELEEGFEAKRYQIKMAALLEEEALLAASTDSNPVAMAALHAKIEELETLHQARLRQIKGRALVEQNRDAATMTGSMRAGWQSSISGMIQGTMTLQKGLQAVWQASLQAFSDFIAKKVIAWALGETVQTGATVAGNATRTASDWMAAVESVAANAWSAVKNIAIKAWEVAASVYSALASIPYIGPFIAPVAAVAATGVVLGFASHVMSAEGGYDIPAGLNPMTQLHEKEMVLPAKHADVIRSMADGSGNSTASGDIHMHVHALDASDVRGFFKRNSHTLAPGLRQMARNFTSTKG